MGVPAFFRWLSRKYPSVIIECIEDKQREVNGVKVPVDASQPNPNQVEFDNLYLDMNGIIHPCTHPEDRPAPRTEDEMMVAIFECIDRLFAIVRPRKVLYMAIDGVAPRAKMNQQRSRRFRASKESSEKVFTMARLRSELESRGAYVPPTKEGQIHFDSNCITPGTPFMARLSMCLQYYIVDRLNSDPAWRSIKVILSDANVPGEGEHKIMDYIRRQRAQPDHDPNTQHVLCGADADLIMLGLATHEPNFTIIREEFKPNKPRPCDLCRQMGHDMVDCTGSARPIDGSEFVGDDEPKYGDETKYIFVRLSVLREYLGRELAMPNLPFPYDFERAVDDWVFMCFFVGNDFLPHLPSLEIREGAIDRLIKLYKDAVYKTGGFLTKSGMVNPSRVQLIMEELGKMEDGIFKERQQRELEFKSRRKANRRKNELEGDCAPAWITTGQFQPHALDGSRGNVEAVTNPRQQAIDMRKEGLNTQNAQAAKSLKSMLTSQVDNPPGQSQEKRGIKRPPPSNLESDDEDDNDEVRLYEDGFKDRYYESKFGVAPDDPECLRFRQKVAAEYTIGLCWVLRYYYQGCASWKWYFPFHYAPFASDFTNIGDLDVDFEKGTEPFQPLEQLMSVFPAASRSHVPEPWAKLMVDPEGQIIDFYPEDFKIDLNGKKFAWQGVALLPFVDENRLKAALKPLHSLLTEAEIQRNVRGDDRLYIRENHPGYNLLKTVYSGLIAKNQEVQLDGKLFQGMRGRVLFSEDNIGPNGFVESVISGLKSLENVRVICVRYRDPRYPSDFVFPSVRLKGAVDPPNVLRPTNNAVSTFRDFRRSNQDSNWRPRFGFDQRRDQANLGEAGHRMLSHRGLRRPPPPMPHMPMISQQRMAFPHGQQQQQSWSSYGNAHSSGNRPQHDNFRNASGAWQQQSNQHYAQGQRGSSEWRSQNSYGMHRPQWADDRSSDRSHGYGSRGGAGNHGGYARRGQGGFDEGRDGQSDGRGREYNYPRFGGNDGGNYGRERGGGGGGRNFDGRNDRGGRGQGYGGSSYGYSSYNQ